MSSRTRALLAGIITAGILIRIPGLLHEGLWRDEAYVYVDAAAPTFSSFLHRVIETEYHPPLYFVISYGWLRAAGISELSLKALPFLCSVLTIPVVYRLGSLAVSRAVGLVAAAMYAVSPLALLDSGDYLYPMMGLLCAALAALVMAARRDALRPGRLLAIALVTTLTVYAHYDALFYVPMLAFWALGSPRGVRHGAALAGAMLLGALPFLLWLPTFLHQPNPYALQSSGTPLYVAPPTALTKLGFFAWTIVRSMPLWPEKLAIVLCLFLAVGLIQLVVSRKVNPDAVAMGLIYLIALAIVSVAGRLNVRYVVPFEGLLCVFLAWIVVSSLERGRLSYPAQWARWGAAVTIVLCVFVIVEDVIFAVHTAGMPKSGIRTFARSQPLDRSTLYVIVPDYMTATFAFYGRNAHVVYTAFPQADHPELFKFGNDASLYGPRAVPDAVMRLGEEARAYDHLDLIVDDLAASNASVRGLVDSITARYPVVARTPYPGRLESVTVYRCLARKV